MKVLNISDETQNLTVAKACGILKHERNPNPEIRFALRLAFKALREALDAVKSNISHGMPAPNASWDTIRANIEADLARIKDALEFEPAHISAKAPSVTLGDAAKVTRH